ncbi:MAG: PKD domain-containing protein, partial [Anaerolineales bacterium]|nr:PKD domain-containing protein [Anaerolineales bacterium]
PAFIALEEIDIEGVDTRLLADLATAGYTYDYAFSHPDVGGHGVAVLWRTDLVSNVSWSTEYQSCSPYGSESSIGYDNYCDGLPDQYPTFSRRPVVVTGTLTLDNGAVEIVVIGNHFKSMIGGEPSALRRLAQGELINQVVSNLIAADSEHVIVLGDLNDFEDSAPLQAMYANGVLTNTWYTLPPEMRYSYIYQGVSQILDHIVVSPAMFEWLAAMGPLHLNADFPFAPYTNDSTVVWRTSDHDPVAATFELPELVVDFSSNSPVRAGQQAEFTDLTTGVGPFTYEWDFGDGSPVSNLANPTHVYLAAGTYTVTLTVTNPYQTLQISHEFVVEHPLIFLPGVFK